MPSKHKYWHKAWSRTPEGHLQHSSGLVVLVAKGNDYTDLVTDDSSLAAWQASETARGVPAHDLRARLQRLMKEAEMWHHDRRNA